MLYAIEIDGTIAINKRRFAYGIHRCRSMGIPPEITDQLCMYHKLITLKQARNSDYIIAIPEAVEALCKLAKEHRVVYITTRPESEAKETREWLERYHFPNPNETYHSKTIAEKYQIAHQLAAIDEEVILIGYRLEKASKAFECLCRARPRIAYELLPRLEIVGVGYNDLPTIQTSIQTSILPSWRAEDFCAWRARGGANRAG